MEFDAWAQIISPLIGLGLTVLYRLVDKYLPDETGNHPLPPARSDGPGSVQ